MLLLFTTIFLHFQQLIRKIYLFLYLIFKFKAMTTDLPPDSLHIIAEIRSSMHPFFDTRDGAKNAAINLDATVSTNTTFTTSDEYYEH